MELRTKELAGLFEAWADTMAQNRDELIRLDQVAGDGDLGLTMAEGFKCMRDYIKANVEMTDMGKLIFQAGKVMNDNAPSSLGTLISAGFKEIGKTFKGKDVITEDEIGKFLEAFETGVMNLGKAKVGEKTFLDGFDPAVQVMNNRNGEDIKTSMARAALKAQEGSANTVGMLAVWGRAARRGEDSRQILDAGSVVASLIITSMSDYICCNF